MTEKLSQNELLALTTEIVASHVSNNTVAVSDLPEVIQKGLRMLDIGVHGLDPDAFPFESVRDGAATPSPHRIFAVAAALAVVAATSSTEPSAMLPMA